MAKQQLPENLNICLVAKTFPYLGRASDHGFMWPIARGLAKKGHHVTVLSWQNPDHQEEVQIENVHAFFMGEKKNVRSNEYAKLVKKKFDELHKSKRFHLVHSLDAGGYQIAKYKKKKRIGVAFDVEATHMSEIVSILGMAQETLGSLLRTGIAVSYKFLRTFWGKDRKLLKTADAVFVTSPQQAIGLERYYLFPEARTYRVSYGIEMGDLSPKEKSDELRKKLGFPPDAHVVVTVSDMNEVGEMRNILRAFEQLAIKKPSARLLVLGTGPKFKEIEYEMLSLVLGSRVVFAGAMNPLALADHIALADVFVNLSSRTTGFEPSILEAMAQKKVVIGSEVSPISNIIEEAKDGFLIRPADIEALSFLFLQIFHDPTLAAEMGERARLKVMNLFDTEKMVAQTLDAYYQTLLNTGWYRK